MSICNISLFSVRPSEDEHMATVVFEFRSPSRERLYIEIEASHAGPSLNEAVVAACDELTKQLDSMKAVIEGVRARFR